MAFSLSFWIADASKKLQMACGGAGEAERWWQGQKGDLNLFKKALMFNLKLALKWKINIELFCF